MSEIEKYFILAFERKTLNEIILIKPSAGLVVWYKYFTFAEIAQ